MKPVSLNLEYMIMEPYLEMFEVTEPVSVNMEYKYDNGTILGDTGLSNRSAYTWNINMFMEPVILDKGRVAKRI